MRTGCGMGSHPPVAAMPCKAWRSSNVFESVEAAAEEVKPLDGRSQKPQLELQLLRIHHLKSRSQINSQETTLRSKAGFPMSNGTVNSGQLCAWEVKFPKFDSKGNKISSTNRVFSVKKFMGSGSGISEAQADAAALEAAMAFRAELVEKGILSEPKPRDPNFTSEVPGVKWKQELKKWRVDISRRGSKEKIYGGSFIEKAAAEAKALELREKHGLQRQVKPLATLRNRYVGLPVFHPKVPYARVNWSQAEQQWHAKSTVGGATQNFRVRPKDHSEAELERSFQVAVAWKKKQEKEKEKEGKAVKSKAKPGKKQRK